MIMITFNASSDRHLVDCHVTSQRMVEWQIGVNAAVQPIRRAPLNIALIIDRSGSMGGDKLAYVKQAALHLLDQLDERDRVAVVAYDDEVLLLAAGQYLTPTTRQPIRARIQALQPGGWTNLAGGWLTGCNAISTRLASEGVNRALLLTDGLANRGIVDIEDLIHHARELRLRGIATSTFGVGLDFNEHLLEALASNGGGHFFYIARPDQIPTVFRQELGELLTVVARETWMTIGVPRGVTLELLGNLPHERTGERIRIFLGDLCNGDQRHLYTRILIPPDAPNSSIVLPAEFGYADLTGQTHTVRCAMAFTYAYDYEVRTIPISQDLLQRASEVEVAAVADKALQLEREGRRHEASAMMFDALAAAAPSMPPASAAAYTDLAQQMEHGLSEEKRKDSHFQTYQKRHNRKA